MTNNNPHPLIDWLTHHLFMGSTTIYPSPSCFICDEFVIPEEFERYSAGHDIDGCVVVMEQPTDHGGYASDESKIHMRMSSGTSCDSKNHLLITFTTSLWTDVESGCRDTVDISTTANIKDVDSLSIATFKEAFVSAVEKHYTFVPGDANPLQTLVNRFIASM